jgi:hypothetical protein
VDKGPSLGFHGPARFLDKARLFRRLLIYQLITGGVELFTRLFRTGLRLANPLVGLALMDEPLGWPGAFLVAF